MSFSMSAPAERRRARVAARKGVYNPIRNKRARARRAERNRARYRVLLEDEFKAIAFESASCAMYCALARSHFRGDYQWCTTNPHRFCSSVASECLLLYSRSRYMKSYPEFKPYAFGCEHVCSRACPGVIDPYFQSIPVVSAPPSFLAAAVDIANQVDAHTASVLQRPPPPPIDPLVVAAILRTV